MSSTYGSSGYTIDTWYEEKDLENRYDVEDCETLNEGTSARRLNIDPAEECELYKRARVVMIKPAEDRMPDD